MLADPLTKLMKPDRLLNALNESSVHLVPTTQSQIAKWMRQKQRRKTPSAEGKGPESYLDPVTGCIVDSQYSVDLLEPIEEARQQEIVNHDSEDFECAREEQKLLDFLTGTGIVERANTSGYRKGD